MHLSCLFLLDTLTVQQARLCWGTETGSYVDVTHLNIREAINWIIDFCAGSTFIEFIDFCAGGQFYWMYWFLQVQLIILNWSIFVRTVNLIDFIDFARAANFCRIHWFCMVAVTEFIEFIDFCKGGKCWTVVGASWMICSSFRVAVIFYWIGRWQNLVGCKFCWIYWLFALLPILLNLDGDKFNEFYWIGAVTKLGGALAKHWWQASLK